MHDDDPRWDRQWRRMEAMARRGMRRFGNINLNLDSSDWAGGLRAGKMLASGDLRLVALSLIEKQPRHGYDLIKAIEDMSKGFYSPSPGVVYPALTYLEEAGYTTSSTDGNKKLYTITETGRAHLGENREAVDSTLNFLTKAGTRMREWGERMASPDFPFTPEQAQKFRDMQHGGWPFRGPESTGETPEATEPSAPADLDELRKAIKKAVRRAESEGGAEKRRVAIILVEALKAIRAGRRDPDADIAL
jgi:DNA-binding PadR family transcriptional regulator